MIFYSASASEEIILVYTRTRHKYTTTEVLPSSSPVDVSSLRETRDHRRPAQDPMIARRVRRHVHEHHEIRRVPRRRELAPALLRPVHRAPIRVGRGGVLSLGGRVGVRVRVGAGASPPRPQPKHGRVREENLRRRLPENAPLDVPVAPFQEEPADVHALLRRGVVVRVRVHPERGELKRHLVDRRARRPREILQRGGEKRVHEEEAAHPMHRGRAALAPSLERLHARAQVREVRRRGLQRRVRHVAPGDWHGVDAQRLARRVVVAGHDRLTFDRGRDRGQRAPNDVQESVEARHLLGQHRVHGLLVRRRPPTARGVDVEVVGERLEELVNDRGDVILALPGAAAAAALALPALPATAPRHQQQRR
eukprot:3917-Pelagococcus_subviridis.AAC.2